MWLRGHPPDQGYVSFLFSGLIKVETHLHHSFSFSFSLVINHSSRTVEDNKKYLSERNIFKRRNVYVIGSFSYSYKGTSPVKTFQDWSMSWWWRRWGSVLRFLLWLFPSVTLLDSLLCLIVVLQSADNHKNNKTSSTTRKYIAIFFVGGRVVHGKGCFGMSRECKGERRKDASVEKVVLTENDKSCTLLIPFSHYHQI